ncbi:MAG: plasminogen-binding N-terminal domain-containing protein [Helicobacteraceae bacterium]|nr:plasminogen-binding N-terminal domain-containing protein [Helicobacteraceae bacterium]
MEGYVDRLLDGGAVKVDVKGAALGSSAVIIYSYDSGEMISRECVVAKATKNGAEIDCKPFALFNQDSVPVFVPPITRGDRVVFEPLSQSAIIIAPTIDRYVRAADRNKRLRLIHPDLFAIALTKKSNPTPSQDDFSAFCDRQMAGVVILALSDGDYVLDCQSFALLSVSADNPSLLDEEVVMPFFHRLNEIGGGFFAGVKTVSPKDFDAYYKQLINKDFNAGN